MPEKYEFEWNEADWRLDTELLSPEARGVYRDILGHLYLQKDRSGVITGSRETLAAAGRCSTVQIDVTLQELKKHRIADITERAGVVTLVNRRMKREKIKRQSCRDRVQRHRSGFDCNGHVTNPLISDQDDKDDKALSSLSLKPEGECKGETHKQKNRNSTGNAVVTSRVKHEKDAVNIDENRNEKTVKHECNGESNSAVTSKKSRLTDSQRDLAHRFEIVLGHQWINDAGKWVNRIKNAKTFGKTTRVLAEVESATKENRIRETPAQYAEQIWKEFQ